MNQAGFQPERMWLRAKGCVLTAVRGVRTASMWHAIGMIGLLALLAAGPVRAEGPVAAAPTEPTTLAVEEASLSGLLEARVQFWGDHLRGLTAALPGLPAEFMAAGGRLQEGLAGHGPGEVALLLAVFVGLGVAAEMLFGWATKGYRSRLQSAPFVTVPDRIRAVFSGLSLDLAHVLCFAAGSVGGFLAMTWPPLLRRVVVGYLAAVLVFRLTLALGRFLFAPDNARLRVLPMDDAAASFWQKWCAAFVGWFAFGYVTIEILRQLGMNFLATQDLAYVLGLGLLGILLRMIWRPTGPAHPTGRIAATVLVVTIWIAWVISAPILMWVLIIGAGLAVAIRVTHRAVMHLFRPVEATDQDAHVQPVSVWAVIVDRGARALLIVAAIWLLISVLNVDMNAIAGQDTPLTRFLIGAAHAVVILLIADLLWQLARTAIDRQLRETQPAGGHGEEVDTVLSVEEMRRRSRLRTLLPILRIVLFVVLAAIAILMALSELGVQIAPLIAGAGVVGVAVGFGSQTLVKDIISGMFYLLDDAFRVGEYIVSGNYRGTVEGFSLRSIRLRHHRGPIFTVPFGMLGAIQNLSRDWVIDKITVGVTYDTNLDLVKKVVKQVSREIMADPALAKGIIQPLKSQGVAAMGDFAIQVRLKFMAKPGEQFVVRRVIYDKIKKAFDANGIKFAFPTVTVAGGEGMPSAAVAQQAVAMIQKPAAE